MPLTSLNQVIAILIVGNVPVCWVAFRLPQVFAEINNSAGTVLTGFIFVTSSIVFGILIDTLTEIWIRRWIVERSANSAALSRLFSEHKWHQLCIQWRNL